MIENKPLVYIKRKKLINVYCLINCFDLEHYAKSHLYVYLHFHLNQIYIYNRFGKICSSTVWKWFPQKIHNGKYGVSGLFR